MAAMSWQWTCEQCGTDDNWDERTKCRKCAASKPYFQAGGRSSWNYRTGGKKRQRNKKDKVEAEKLSPVQAAIQMEQLCGSLPEGGPAIKALVEEALAKARHDKKGSTKPSSRLKDAEAKFSKKQTAAEKVDKQLEEAKLAYEKLQQEATEAAAEMEAARKEVDEARVAVQKESEETVAVQGKAATPFEKLAETLDQEFLEVSGLGRQLADMSATYTAYKEEREKKKQAEAAGKQTAKPAAKEDDDIEMEAEVEILSDDSIDAMDPQAIKKKLKEVHTERAAKRTIKAPTPTG